MILHPDQEKEPLRCTFFTHHLLDQHTAAMCVKFRGRPGDYRAISYSWHADADAKDYGSIVCNGKPLRITRNLSDLLYRLRSPTARQSLWVDQLCINQDDEREKEQQIPLMQKVYQQAGDVVFWIGEEDEHNPAAFSLIEKLDSVYREVGYETPQVPPAGAIADDTYTSNLRLPSLRSGEWKPLMEIFARMVFRRLWIVQEIVLGHSVLVMCGSHTIDFEKLGGAASYLGGSDWISILQAFYADAFLEEIDSLEPMIEIEKLGCVDFLIGLYIRRWRLCRKEHADFQQLLLSARMYKTDRAFIQDRVFALLGLLSAHSPDGGIPDELLPNYGKTVDMVFRETAQYLLRQGSLDILSGVEDLSLRRPDLGLPSWVPNFDVFQRATILGMPSHASILKFAAGGDARSESKPVWTCNEPNVMLLEAHKVDEVLIYRSHLQARVPSLSAYRFLEDSAKLVDLFAPYPTGEYVVDAFWRTLIANNVMGMTSPAPQDWRRHFMGYCMQAAAHLDLEWDLRKMKEEGLLPPLGASDMSSLLLERFSRPDNDPKNFILVVKTETSTFPLRPMLKKQSVPGLYNVFTLGLVDRFEPTDYANSNGSMYGSELNVWSFFRRFFVTRDGYFGLAPPSVEQGDAIFILRGGRVPFLLRKVSDTEHMIVGECYVHGIMHGEALKREGFTWESIRIR